MTGTGEWLRDLGLEKYEALFAEHEITVDLLPHLTVSDVDRLSLPTGARRRLLRGIAALGGATPAIASDLRDSVEQSSTATDGERRQLTVLFCDMVGFTGLASRVDPEVLQQIIRSYEDACAACVARYEGYVFQRLGDGIVAFFGYPLAHEREAERAMRAGLEIIESLSALEMADAGRLQVRIGIASGMVVVSSKEKGAVGETMNLAARLQAIATPGSVVVSEQARRLAGGSFEFEELGRQSLKGLVESRPAFRVLGLSQATSLFEAATAKGLSPMVGREKELELLLERWPPARDGEGQVVLLSGEAGIGKSRILGALRERLEAQGVLSLRFQCSPFHVHSAFWPVIDNFDRALNFGRDEPAESRLDKLEALIAGHYRRPLADVRFVASILSIPCDARYGPVATTPQKNKDETLRTLVDITEAAARKQPCVMLFEDLHWADPTTLEVLDLLIDRVRAVPLLIVLTHRPEFDSRWSRHDHVVSLNLSKLSRAQSGALVSRLAWGKALPPDLLEQILAKTDGVPLFVEELTKSILESNELREEADRYVHSGAAHAVTVPATLRDSLLARLDRLGPVKEIARIGAAIGREFSYEIVSGVASMDRGELNEALARMTESGLAFRRGTPPNAVYAFKHALVQEVAYDSLLKSRRQELHGRIARIMDERFPAVRTSTPEILARHLSAADLVDAAIPLWHAAGVHALKRVALVEAISCFKQGLDLLSRAKELAQPLSVELDLQLGLATALQSTEGWAALPTAQAYDRARDLSERLGESEHTLPVLYGQWLSLLPTGKLQPSLQVARHFLSVAERRPDQAAICVGFRLLGTSQHASGKFQAARKSIARSLALYEPAQHVDLRHRFGHDARCLALAILSWDLLALGYPEQALRAATDGVQYARSLDHPPSLIYASCARSLVLALLGERDLLGQALCNCEELLKANRLVAWAAFTQALRGWHHILLGSRSEGIRIIREAVDAWNRAAFLLHSPIFISVLACALMTQGDVAGARNLADRALGLARSMNSHWLLAEVLRMRAILDDAANPEAARRELLHALSIARDQGARLWELRALTALARLPHTKAELAVLRGDLEAAFRRFDEGWDTSDLKEARGLIEELRAGDSN